MEFIITPYQLPPEGSPQAYIAGFEVADIQQSVDEATFNNLVASINIDWCTDVVLVPGTIENGMVKDGNVRARVKPNLHLYRSAQVTLSYKLPGETIPPNRFTLEQKSP